MTSYSLIRVGNDYIVQANDQRVLKLSSRRRAAQLISVATDLLKSSNAQSTDRALIGPSLHRESAEVP